MCRATELVTFRGSPGRYELSVLRSALEPRIGAQRTIDIAKHVFNATNVETLTLFLFSSENWKRPPTEVANIMFLLEEYIGKFGTFLVENNVRVEVIGQVSGSLTHE